MAAALVPAACAVASSALSSLALAAATIGLGLATVTPVAWAFVSGALSRTLTSEVEVPAAMSFCSGALSSTSGGVRCRLTVTSCRFAPVPMTIGSPMTGPLLIGACVPVAPFCV